MRPPIWRRIQVASTINLRQLHDVVQATIDWTQAHLYEFEIDGVTFGEPSLESDITVRSAKSTQLRRVASHAGASASYPYDFGDNWQPDRPAAGSRRHHPAHHSRTWPAIRTASVSESDPATSTIL